MDQFRRVVRWAVFVILALLSYAVLSGVCQSLTSIALRYLNHEFDRRLPELAALGALSLAPFLFAGLVIAWTLPLGRRAVLFTLLTLGVICALVPVEGLPYSIALNAAIRCLLAGLGCGLMVTGARLRLPRLTG